MKLNESKSKVPTTFLTSYISDAWDKIGYINNDIEAIKKEYSDTKVVVDCLQGIVDSYLVAVGILQAVLDGKDISVPEDPKQELKKEETKTIKEAVAPAAQATKPIVKPIAKPVVKPRVKPVVEDIRLPKDDLDADPFVESAPVQQDDDSFNFFPEVPAPDLDSAPLELDPSIFGNLTQK